MTILSVIIDDQSCKVPVGMSIATALALIGNGVTRYSASSQLRASFHGVEVCQKCRVTVSGHRVLACQTECQPKVVIEKSHHAKRRL